MPIRKKLKKSTQSKLSQDADSIEQFCKLLAEENYKLIKAYAATHKEQTAHSISGVASNFVKYFIEYTLIHVLTDRPEFIVTDAQLSDYITYSFDRAKLALQNDVADGFTQAIAKYAGHDIDYYCQILPSPPIANKLPC